VVQNTILCVYVHTFKKHNKTSKKIRNPNPIPTHPRIRFLRYSRYYFLLLTPCFLYKVSMATWRNGHPPVRFDDPVHHVLPRHNFVLHPFSGQPKKYRAPRRLPGCQVRESGIPRAGNGLWTAERVRKGETITIFRRKRISEAAAKKLQKKVPNDFI
jgi:hypothetical protein